MTFKKSPFIQNIKPKTIFTIIIWFIVAWALARPLSGITKNIYHFFGGITNNAFQSILNSKYSLEELLGAKQIADRQSKTIALMKVKINCIENELKETENLKETLNLKQHLRYKTISAKVLGRSADNWHKQVILDRGKNQGIKQGDSVLNKRGIIGQIVEANNNSSVAQLISDPSYKLGCKILRTNTIGILSGKTNSVGLLEFIPVGSDIMQGDIVVTSGIGTGLLPPSYPPGHTVGKILRISKKKSRSSDLYIEVKLFEDLTSLSNVLVFSSN